MEPAGDAPALRRAPFRDESSELVDGRAFVGGWLVNAIARIAATAGAGADRLGDIMSEPGLCGHHRSYAGHRRRRQSTGRGARRRIRTHVEVGMSPCCAGRSQSLTLAWSPASGSAASVKRGLNRRHGSLLSPSLGVFLRCVDVGGCFVSEWLWSVPRSDSPHRLLRVALPRGLGNGLVAARCSTACAASRSCSSSASTSGCLSAAISASTSPSRSRDSWSRPAVGGVGAHRRDLPTRLL